jgi:hypothetical protein
MAVRETDTLDNYTLLSNTLIAATNSLLASYKQLPFRYRPVLYYCILV